MTTPRPIEQHEANLVDLDMLLRAIRDGDPQRELDVRVRDIIDRTRRCVEKYKRPSTAGERWMMDHWIPMSDTRKAGGRRVFVAGYTKPTDTVAGYWWWHEDNIIDGKPVDHPNATHWIPIQLPPFPAPPSVQGEG